MSNLAKKLYELAINPYNTPLVEAADKRTYQPLKSCIIAWQNNA